MSGIYLLARRSIHLAVVQVHSEPVHFAAKPAQSRKPAHLRRACVFAAAHPTRERPNNMTMTIFQATTLRVAAALAIGAVQAAYAAPAVEFPNPLPAEIIPKVEKLPAHYPTTWSWLNYAGDRIELRNVGSDSREVKGQLQSHDSATLLVADNRPEIYVADTVWSRGARGARTDFITIYDKQTFEAIGEIVLPGTKRALITAMEGLIAFTDEQRMALVFNFTPASSVTVVDLVKRRPLGEIEIPACSLVYPIVPPQFSPLSSS